MNKQTDENEQKATTSLDLCRDVVVPKITSLFQGYDEPLDEEQAELIKIEEEMFRGWSPDEILDYYGMLDENGNLNYGVHDCGMVSDSEIEAALVGWGQHREGHLKFEKYVNEKQLKIEKKKAYKRGKADAYLSVIEKAVRIAPDRNSDEIKEIRNSMLQVMPAEYHERINKISSVRIYKTENKMIIINPKWCQFNEGYGANINYGTQNFSCGEEKRKPHYDEAEVVEDEEEDEGVCPITLTDEQQAAFNRAAEANFIKPLGNGKYRLLGQKVSLAYFIGRLFCRDYVDRKKVWRVGDNFPARAVEAMFGVKNIASYRSNRKDGNPPEDYKLIDSFIEG